VKLDPSIHIGARRPAGVLLLHGLGGTPAELTTLARALQAAGFAVHCCRLAGHCGTADELRATTWRDWYASAEFALAELEAICGRVVVGGLSMGALLAARLARENPGRVHGLVMLAPTFWYDGWAMPWYRFLLPLLINTPLGRRYSFVESEPYGLKDERVRRRVVAAMRRGESANAGLLATPSEALQEMWRLSAEVRRGLAATGQETLLVHSRDDDVASLRNAFEVQARLGGRVETLVLEDSYHLVTVDRQRALVARRVAEFAGRIGASPEAAAAASGGMSLLDGS
jgi:carboxylesterase